MLRHRQDMEQCDCTQHMLFCTPSPPLTAVSPAPFTSRHAGQGPILLPTGQKALSTLALSTLCAVSSQPQPSALRVYTQEAGDYYLLAKILGYFSSNLLPMGVSGEGGGSVLWPSTYYLPPNPSKGIQVEIWFLCTELGPQRCAA